MGGQRRLVDLRVSTADVPMASGGRKDRAECGWWLPGGS